MIRIGACLMFFALLVGLAGCGKYENSDPTGATVKILYDRSGSTPGAATQPSGGVHP